MKYLVEVPRVLLGLIFFVFGMAGLLHLLPHQELQGAAGAYMTGLTGTYLLTLVKATEVAAGAAFLSNRFVPLALVVIAPVMVNIFGFHAFYAPTGLALPVVMVAAQIFLAWRHRSAFTALLTPKHAVVSGGAAALSGVEKGTDSAAAA